MKSFLKAILLSLRYKWTIAAAIVCSMLIASLWAASITTVFPVVKIVLEGETAQSWIATEIEQAETSRNAVVGEIEQMKMELTSASVEESRTLNRKIDLRMDRLNAENSAIERFEYLQPIVAKYAPDSPFMTLVWAMVWLLATSILKGIVLVLSAILVARVANRTVMDLRRIYYRKALELDQRRIEKLGTSNMMVHLSSNMIMVSGGLQVFYGKSIREPLKMVTCLVGAALISFPLLLISLVVVPAGAFLIHSVAHRMKHATKKEIAGMAEVYQTLIETFSSLKTVRIFNRESTERRRFKKNAAVLYRMAIRISLFDSLLRPITEVLGIISIALSVLAGSYIVLNQQTDLFGFHICDRPLKPSMLVLFYTMLAGASDPARKMSEIVNVLVRGGTACDNLTRTYDAKPNVVAATPPVPVPLHSQSIEFQNVVFHYEPKQPVLKRIQLTIPFGQSVAIVGGNGCGKSTMMNLLARFYDPKRGAILLDGKNIRDMNPRKLRRQIAWVTQQSVLFKGSVWENISYGARNPTKQQILEAAKVARVDQFIEQLNNGYHSEVGDNGTLLSAGQRQRVALARAVLADPKILILDEATSQMDGNTESLIHESLANFIQSRTTFVVTHRQSSLNLVDRVVVMDSGRIVHDGSVKEARETSEDFNFLFAKSA
ncbi:MAG: ABC transporter ATP-binding protein/permease [Mariniblastus sp.]|nr:ABC transporter ATP-binding protein/permease [Mariniblastus sp.]